MASHPKVRTLTSHERTILEHRTKSANTEHSRIARMILASSNARSLEDIGEELGVHSETVRRWVSKFNQRGLEGITPGKRGPRLRFSLEQREQILRIANTSPKELGQEFSEWSSVKLANYAVEQGITDSISHVSVRQILREAEFTRGASARNHKLEGMVVPGRPLIENGQIAPPQSGESSPREQDRSEALGRIEAAISEGQDFLANRKFDAAVMLLSPLLAESGCNLEQEAEIRCILSSCFQGKDQQSAAKQVIEVYEIPDRRAGLTPGMNARVRLRLGWICNLGRDYPRAFARFNEALPSFIELRDTQGASETHYALGRTYYEINEYKIARDHLLEAVHYQRFENDRQLLANIYFTLGLVDYYEGDFTSAKSHYQKALELARFGSDHKLLGQLSVNSGLVCMYDSFPDRTLASQRFREAIDHFEHAGEWDYLCLAYNNLADNLIHSGKWQEGEESLLSALEKAEARNASKYQAIALATLGELAAFRGKYEKAKEYLGRCMELLPQVGSKWVEGVVELVLGNFYAAIGDHGRSRDRLNASLQISTSLGNQFNRSLAHIALGELCLTGSELRPAREHLRTAEEAAKESASLVLSGRLKRLNGLIDAAEGYRAEGVQHLSQSVAAFATAQDVFEEARSRLDLGKILLTIGGEEQTAAQEFQQALKAFETLAAGPYIEASRKILREGSSPRRDFAQPLPQNHPGPLSAHGAAASASSSAGIARSRAEPARSLTPTLFMERLIEAASSPELLLQELASIAEYMYSLYLPVGITIYRILEQDVLQPLIVRGPELPAAQEVQREIAEAIASGRSDTATGKVAVIAAGGRDSLAVHLRTSRGPALDLDPMRPFFKQAEVILENLALRSLRRSGTAPHSEAVKYSVREALPGFLYASQVMAEVIERIHKIRRSDVTVLITGESGTGKELVARTIHTESARRSAIFLPFNCTAVSPELIESQLFGHRRGSFTGAVDHYQGIVRAAEGGTLFLDEIGDLSLQVQPKLLRFLQEGEIQPVGQAKPEKVDVRIITATNSDLERAVEDGRFREDLYHRLNIIRIHVPPLRERPEEIPVLAEHYLGHFAKRSGRSGLTFSREVLDLFLSYDWPGNVRQLRNEIERAVAYSGAEEIIRPGEISPEILQPRRNSERKRQQPRRNFMSGAGQSGSGTQETHPESRDFLSESYLQFPLGRDAAHATGERSSDVRPSPSDDTAESFSAESREGETGGRKDSASRDLITPGWFTSRSERSALVVPPRDPRSDSPSSSSLKAATEELERRMITEALARYRYNVTKTAAALGLSRRGLRMKIDQLGIEI